MHRFTRFAIGTLDAQGSSMLYLAATLALVIGALLGLLGGGGSILTVPMLVYLLGVPAKSAIPTSLIVVGVTSLAAVVPAARAGHVQFRAGGFIAGGAVIGAFGGGRIAHYVPGNVLLAAFGALMLAAAFAMMRPKGSGSDEKRALSVLVSLLVGVAIGVVSGLVGAGGGFLIVPALVLVAGVPMRAAVGTSLFVIALQSIAGFAGQIGHAEVDMKLAIVVTVASAIGSQVGVAFGKRLSAGALRSAFAWLVLVLGAFVLGREAHPALGIGGAFAVIAVALWLRSVAARKVPPPAPTEDSPYSILDSQASTKA